LHARIASARNFSRVVSKCANVLQARIELLQLGDDRAIDRRAHSDRANCALDTQTERTRALEFVRKRSENLCHRSDSGICARTGLRDRQVARS
jgi:hypothetical protein